MRGSLFTVIIGHARVFVNPGRRPFFVAFLLAKRGVIVYNVPVKSYKYKMLCYVNLRKRVDRHDRF